MGSSEKKGIDTSKHRKPGETDAEFFEKGLMASDSNRLKDAWEFTFGKDARPPEYKFQRLDGGWDPRMGGPGNDLSEQMRMAMMGEAPSAAQLQMQNALGGAIGGAQGASSSNPLLSAGLAQRNAANQSAAMGGQINRDTGGLRAQETHDARGKMAAWMAQQKQFEMRDQMRRQEEQDLMNKLMLEQELKKARLSGSKGLLGRPADLVSKGLGAWSASGES